MQDLIAMKIKSQNITYTANYNNQSNSVYATKKGSLCQILN